MSRISRRFGRHHLPVLSLFLFLAAVQPAALRAQSAIHLEVDASEASRRIFHARLVMEASPGPLALLYPKWIPGEHGPTGPVTDLAGLRISAGGRPLVWRRDDIDMYQFSVEVPAGAKSVEVDLDFLSSPPETRGFTAGASATAQLAIVSWNQLLLYPRGKAASDLEYRARITLPEGWQLATALPVAARSNRQVIFEPVSLETLVDSPVLCGAHLREVAIGPAGNPAHFVNMAADDAASLEFPPEWRATMDRLVEEAGKLFGARHYRSYRFLLALSDHIAHFGLEHHESSDNRVPARTLVDANLRSLEATLLPHEFVHSWNGKYRRPAGLATRDFHEPMRGSMLWVYEGLTQYLGELLAVRSGLWTPEQYRDNLARTAQWARDQQGRTWASLEDTAVAAQLRFNARRDWGAWRRGADFYNEGTLIWLDADTLIREQTQGSKSLDDFCRLFYGGQDSPPSVNPYTMDDLVAALNSVAPHDWKSFLAERVTSIAPQPPLAGIERGGWRLAYEDSAAELQRTSENRGRIINLNASIGLSLRNDGSVIDVIPGKAADRAGIAPGMKLVSVNSQRWSEEGLRNAVAATRQSGPLQLSVDNSGFLRSYSLNYHDGARYPRLERDASRPDLLAQILKPLSTNLATDEQR